MTMNSIPGRIRSSLASLAGHLRARGPSHAGEGDGAGRARRRKNIQLALNIVILVMINVAAMTLKFRCDLTRDNTYSLSTKSIETVANLKENLKIKVLFTRDLPAQHTSLYRYLIDLLDEYEYYGNEYFSYEVVPEKDLEKVAADYGIRPVQSQEFDSDQVKVRRAYMGLVIQQSDVIEKIEAVTDPTGLEYSITSLIEKMSGKIDGLLGLGKPIRVLLFMGEGLKTLPIEGIDGLQERVAAAVEKSNAVNYDKLKLEVLDPSADRTIAATADGYGVARLNWRAGRDRFGRAIPAGEAHLGIVLAIDDRAELVDLSIAPTLTGKNVIVGLDKLEDSLNAAVSSLVSVNPRIGYVVGHGEVDLNDQQSQAGGALLRQVLSDVYDIAEVDLAKEEIPGDLGLIVVNGPRGKISEGELYKIDQFLMKGKAAIFFLDSFTELNLGQQGMFARQPMVIPLVTGLEPLLEHYGITVEKNIVLDKSCARGMVAGALKDFYHVPIIKGSGFDGKSVITRYLKGMAFMKVSSVGVDEKGVRARACTAVPLVSSSEESWLMEGEINLNPFFMSPPEKEGEMRRYPLAVLLSGPFESYFKGKDVPAEEGAAGGIAVQKLDGTVKSGESRVIVVGTSEITRSGFLMNARRIMSSATSDRDEQDRVFSNGFFIHSAADYLLGNDFIPEMASKSLEFNPLEKTGDRVRIVLKALNIAGVPILVILAGLVIWRRRSSRKKTIRGQFARGGGDEI
ncbi:MAG: Gldg family protein [Spirochaetes bacterium]|nr:Gldg family protein [Spirochaetota bacterium]